MELTDVVTQLSNNFGITLTKANDEIFGKSSDQSLQIYCSQTTGSVYLRKRHITGEFEDLVLHITQNGIEASYLTFSDKLARLRFGDVARNRDQLVRKLSENISAREIKPDEGYHSAVMACQTYSDLEEIKKLIKFFVEEFKQEAYDLSSDAIN